MANKKKSKKPLEANTSDLREENKEDIELLKIGIKPLEKAKNEQEKEIDKLLALGKVNAKYKNN